MASSSSFLACGGISPSSNREDSSIILDAFSNDFSALKKVL